MMAVGITVWVWIRIGQAEKHAQPRWEAILRPSFRMKNFIFPGYITPIYIKIMITLKITLTSKELNLFLAYYMLETI